MTSQRWPNSQFVIRDDLLSFSSVLDDECKCRHIPNVRIHPSSTCGRLSTVRGPNQKVISFSFFSRFPIQSSVVTEINSCDLSFSSNGYFAGIEKNLESVRKFYPGYSMRLYHNIPLNSR